MAIYKYVKITLTVLKFLIYRKEFFGMRKFTLDAWNRHTDRGIWTRVSPG